jgi:hypothetical protein
MSPRGIGHDEFAVDEGNEILQAFFRTDRFQQHLFFLPVKWQHHRQAVDQANY